jgi:hypothetical protein
VALGVSGLTACGIWLAWAKPTRTREDGDSVTAESEDSFPASDAPSHTPLMGSRVAIGH